MQRRGQEVYFSSLRCTGLGLAWLPTLSRAGGVKQPQRSYIIKRVVAEIIWTATKRQTHTDILILKL